MKQQLITMLQMQDAMNSKVNHHWRQKNFEWYRAIWVECAELMDHYGWKWWKKQEIDRSQVVLELIDIWHFGLSILISDGRSLDSLAEDMATQLAGSKPKGGSFCEVVEEFAEETLRTRQFSVASYAKLMVEMDLTFAALYANYVGKNVLNFFRQDNGYQEGSYIKIWSGKEDNEHLVEVLNELDTNRSDFKEAVYSGLQSRYPIFQI